MLHRRIYWIASLLIAMNGCAARAQSMLPTPATVPTTEPTTRASTRPTSRPSTRPVEAIRRVIVVSIDGLRPDLALRADTPTIHSLLPQASFTFWARTTAVCITLPSHVSMLTGVSPSKHGIEWNRDLPFSEPYYPQVPTLFQMAKRYGYTTAIAVGKDKFDVFAQPGTLDWQYVPPKAKKPLDQVADTIVADHAVEIIAQHRPQVMFVHFPGTDKAGHEKGWSSPEQMAAIHDADAALGRVIQAAKDAGVFDETLLIITADHGGQGKGHGADDPRSRHIPWIAVGPTIRPNYDLSVRGDLNVNTEDTYATAVYVLGIPDERWGADDKPVTTDGKAVKEIFPPPAELLQDNKK